MSRGGGAPPQPPTPPPPPVLVDLNVRVEVALPLPKLLEGEPAARFHYTTCTYAPDGTPTVTHHCTGKVEVPPGTRPGTVLETLQHGGHVDADGARGDVTVVLLLEAPMVQGRRGTLRCVGWVGGGRGVWAARHAQVCWVGGWWRGCLGCA